MNTKMISIVRISMMILIVVLLYLGNTPSNGDPSIILFKLIFCGGIGIAGVIFWVKSEYMRSEFKRDNGKVRVDYYSNHNKDETHNYKGIYFVEDRGNKIKNFILILAAIATIITAIVTILR